MSHSPAGHRAVLAAVAALAVLADVAVTQQRRDTLRLPELVVTATRLPEAPDEVPATVTVLQGDDLRARGVRFVLDGLREVPGVQVVQSGSFGGAASLFLRGGESNYVKVLVDGVPVNQPGGAFDLAHLTTDNVDRIEVVRGPASVLYGSDAVTGVIQIFTRRSAGATRLGAAVEGGTYGTVRWDVSAVGGGEALGWSAALARQTTDGIYDFNSDYRNTVASAAVRVTPDDRTDAALSFRYHDGAFHYPTDFTGTPVDRNQFNTSETTTFSLDAGRRLADWIEARVVVGVNDITSGAENRPDPAPGPADYLTSLAQVDRRTADVRAIVHPGLGATLMAGVGYDDQSEQSSSRSDGPFGPSESTFEATRTNWAYYLQGAIDPVDPLSLTAGLRLDDNERFGEFVTFRLGAVARLAAATRLRGSVGTAFKEPSFFENFATGFVVGNPDLDPERGRTWELGVEQDLLRRSLTLSATYFNQRFRDLIQYTPSPAEPGDPNYVNIGDARAYGLEVEATARPAAGVAVTAAYTRLVTRVLDPGFASGEDSEFVEGEALLRRPGHSGSVRLSYDWHGRARFGLVTTVVGARDDLRFAQFPEPTRRVTLPAYATVDLSADVVVVSGAGVRPPVRLLARAANLFDETYEQIANYRSAGRTITIGAALGLP